MWLPYRTFAPPGLGTDCSRGSSEPWHQAPQQDGSHGVSCEPAREPQGIALSDSVQRQRCRPTSQWEEGLRICVHVWKLLSNENQRWNQMQGREGVLPPATWWNLNETSLWMGWPTGAKKVILLWRYLYKLQLQPFCLIPLFLSPCFLVLCSVFKELRALSMWWIYGVNLLNSKVLICCFAYSLSHVQLFCYPMDCSLPGSSVHGILQARTLEWVAISSSRGSSESSTIPALAGKFFTTEPQGKPKVLIRSIKNPCHLQPIRT